jgi:hypothetical protein
LGDPKKASLCPAPFRGVNQRGNLSENLDFGLESVFKVNDFPYTFKRLGLTLNLEIAYKSFPIRCFVDQLRQIHEMLDSCLTTEILSTIDRTLQRWLDIFRTRHAKTLRHRKIQIALLEKVGNTVEEHFDISLKGNELIQVGRRVDDFLLERGYRIKTFL